MTSHALLPTIRALFDFRSCLRPLTLPIATVTGNCATSQHQSFAQEKSPTAQAVQKRHKAEVANASATSFLQTRAMPSSNVDIAPTQLLHQTRCWDVAHSIQSVLFEASRHDSIASVMDPARNRYAALPASHRLRLTQLLEETSSHCAGVSKLCAPFDCRLPGERRRD